MFKNISIDRDLAKAFSVTARCACFRQAARSLNVNSTLLRKQLRHLEVEIGEQLFHYQERALHLTNAGTLLHQELARRYADLNADETYAELIRIAAPEALLNDILARNLISFIRQHGGLRIEFLPLEGTPVEQADVMVWLAEQESPRPDPGFAMTKPHRLATISFYPHIATRYSAEGRHPTSSYALDDYMLVQQRTNQSVPAFRPWNKLVSQRQSSVTFAPKHELVWELIKNSACIGLLPEYASKLDKKLLPLKEVFNDKIQRVAWLSSTPLAAAREDVQSVIKLILNAFEERKTWFE
ncbi:MULTISPECIES: LysR family transcriptional regulator [Pseudomonas]|uniref:LysR family transcriptional regulator n=1 Tax=Pseudomonas TaxID=286 RepID=UPI001C7F1977|nr:MULTISPECIES: LysR family transcriptional regulator [Pseudomonas]MDH0897600.1 LysR family transcriptional regulator [Pseudomonas sp. GD03875]MDH1067628.1 LysR family transcriptional regulator [Pseudomonas sp. GD03985]